MLVCLADSADALNPNKAVSQYVRDRWDAEQGFPGGPVTAFAQTPDGYLWIGTEKGLVRFDGISFVLFRHADSAKFPVGAVLGLAVDAEGNLWMRLQGPSFLRYRGGTFQDVFPELHPAGADITAMCTGECGDVLFSGLVTGLVRYREGRFVTLARPESPRLVISMAETPDGKVWLGTREQGLYYLDGGGVSSIARELPDKKINTLLAIGDHELWIGTDNGLALWNGKELLRPRMFHALDHTQIVVMASDRNSNVWVGTSDGLKRINAKGVSSLELDKNRPADTVTALFEDREGNLWVGTPRGVERLRDTVFTTYSVSGGLPSESNGPLFADSEGRTWFAPTEGGLYWLKEGRVGRVTAAGLGADVVYSIDGRRGELWIGRRQGLTQLRYGGSSFSPKTYTHSQGLAQNSIYAVHQNRDGTVWAGTLNAGLSRFKNGRFTTFTTANGLASNTIDSIIETSDGTMWFGTPNGLNSLSNGQWRTYTAQSGLPPGNVNCLLEDAIGTLWIGTDNGLAFMRSGTIYALGDMPGPLHEQIFGLEEDRTGSVWIATANHILRVDRDRLARQVLGKADVREYGLGDGLLSAQGVNRYRSVVADPLGQIWFSTNRGLSFASPTSMDFRSVPALVHVGGVSADGRQIDVGEGLRIPAPHQRITFSYTGLSLSVPTRVKFMYRLDGFDERWTEPTSAREAIYTNLNAGRYRFRVVASNSDGVWNSAEASLPFEVLPTFWQTRWFQLCGALMIGLGALAFFRLRVLRLTSQLNMRFEERLAERTRIAQELHDTLLQGVISASMQLHVVTEQIPADSTARHALQRVAALMGRVVEEGRHAVGGLRSPNTRAVDLGQALSEIPREFLGENKMEFRVIVEGLPRPLNPVIRDEVFHIGREALINAFRHAQAKSVEVELEYASYGLRVLVRDSGVGFDSNVLRFGRDGHWGLSGMRERAKRIGARLRVLSRPAAGTEVELTVPGAIAFLSPPSKGAAKWLRSFLPAWKQAIERFPSEREQ